MSDRILIIELKEFNSTSLSGTYQDFGSALANPAFKFQVFNSGTTDAYISKDGSTNWLRIPASGSLTLDESTLVFPGEDQAFYLPRGTQLKVKQVTAPGASGAIISHVVTRRSF